MGQATVTFIHAADLHIGAPFRGLRAVSGAWADRLVRAIPEAYNRLIEAAISRDVDFVVIAGDVFDEARPSFADFAMFFDGLRRLDAAGIPTYLCCGNHDPYTSWRDQMGVFPESVYMFPADKPGFALARRPGRVPVVLCGRSYYSQTVSGDTSIAGGLSREAAFRALGDAAAGAPFAVGVLHTGLNLDTLKAPVSPKELVATGIDYWALGHIHMPWLDDAENPRIGFSGVIQGRDIKECGARGCYQVTLREGLPNQVEFLPLASVAWQRFEVDVSACETLVEASGAVMREAFRLNGHAYCEEMVERVTLVGRTPLHRMLGAPFAVGVLHTGLNLDTLKAPVSPKELVATGIDYWALGHIHMPWLDDAENPRIGFSGVIQGRDIKECGARGCYQVTLREGLPNQVEFLPLASVAWQRFEVDVSACETLVEASGAVMREAFRLNGHAYCEEMVERVTLVGRTPLHRMLGAPGVLEDMRAKINEGYPMFFCDALIDATRPPIDYDALAREGLFPSLVLKQHDAQGEDDHAALAYLQERFTEHGLQLPASCVRRTRLLQEQARDLVIDLLGGDAE